MRKLAVLEFLSLDGVMQAPGDAKEDTSGGFKHGGWIVPYPLGRVMLDQMGRPFDLLLGRRTYDIFAGYWPQHNDAIGVKFNKATKYVVTKRPVKIDWKTTIPIRRNVVKEINTLKQEDGPDLQIYGSGDLVQTLLRNDLVDEFWLKIFPVTLGTGKRLFAGGTLPRALTMMESQVLSNGVIIANYKPSGPVKPGSF